MKMICVTCSGTGWCEGSPAFTCPECKGVGELEPAGDARPAPPERVVALGGRNVRVSMMPDGAPCRDHRGRIAVRNVETNRLSYVPEHRLKLGDARPAPEPPDRKKDHDAECETELTSHGYTPCRCAERTDRAVVQDIMQREQRIGDSYADTAPETAAEYHRRAAALRRLLAAPPAKVCRCEWTIDDAGGDSMNETTCGHAFEFNDGLPSDNGFRWCPYCGKPLAEVLTSRAAPPDRLEPINPVLPDRSGPISLNVEQERATKEWAADDRLWTTQETVEFNLRTFARKILSAAPPEGQEPPRFPAQIPDTNRKRIPPEEEGGPPCAQCGEHDGDGPRFRLDVCEGCYTAWEALPEGPWPTTRAERQAQPSEKDDPGLLR